MYPPLPTPPAPRADETVQQYGLTIFGFVLATETTATVPNYALELAAHAYPLIVSAPDLAPTTLDRFAQVDREIKATLRRRAQDQAPAPDVDPRTTTRPSLDDDTNNDGGRLAPRPTRPTPPPPPALRMPAPIDF